MGMLDHRVEFKPFAYPWAVQATKKQQQIHWLPEEVKMDNDVKDWAARLTPFEKSLATNVMLLFTQSDKDVGDGYVDHYLKRIKNPEIRWMLTTFAGQEVIHMFAYAHLLETLGFKDETFTQFSQYEAMRAKHDHAAALKSGNNFDLCLTMAAYGGFMEGLQLFASFIMLLNFQRFGRLKGMGQIIAWSVRDETLHCVGVSRMHREFYSEYVHTSTRSKQEMTEAVINECLVAVNAEDAFIDQAYEMGPVQGLTADDVKKFIRYIADRRLEGLGYEPIFGVKTDPQPWFAALTGGVEHTNFFENRSTAYAKAATTGSYF